MKNKYKISTMIFLFALANILNAQTLGIGLSNHTMLTDASGVVYTWGFNVTGQLGNGTNTDSNVPTTVITSGVLKGKTITAVAKGVFHSLALSSDGAVYTWGHNYNGQLGIGTNTEKFVPVAVITSGELKGKTIIAIAAGYDHSIALASDGTVYTWGHNNNGQLGNKTTTDSNVPVAVITSGVLNGKTIIAVAAGFEHTLALASDGTVYTWGANSRGQLGNGVKLPSNVPVAVTTIDVLSGKTITAIAAGFQHSIALASDGSVYTWGYNGNGQLGNGSNGTYSSSNVPVAVTTTGALNGKTITAIDGGIYHTLALASDGSVYAWGNNKDGQLGNGTTINSNDPIAVITSGVLNGKTITNIACGAIHSIALDSDGEVYAWGNNNYGQLGDGTNTNSNVPVLLNDSPLAVEVEVGLSAEFSLSQNYPNPFNPTTQISYQLSKNGNVELTVYNSLGQQVAELIKEYQSNGKYSISFDASNLPSGVYFYKLQINNLLSVKKMLLTK